MDKGCSRHKLTHTNKNEISINLFPVCYQRLSIILFSSRSVESHIKSEILTYYITTKYFKCFRSPSLLNIQGMQTTFLKARKTFCTLFVIYQQLKIEDDCQIVSLITMFVGTPCMVQCQGIFTRNPHSLAYKITVLQLLGGI